MKKIRWKAKDVGCVNFVYSCLESKTYIHTTKITCQYLSSVVKPCKYLTKLRPNKNREKGKIVNERKKKVAETNPWPHSDYERLVLCFTFCVSAFCESETWFLNSQKKRKEEEKYTTQIWFGFIFFGWLVRRSENVPFVHSIVFPLCVCIGNSIEKVRFSPKWYLMIVRYRKFHRQKNIALKVEAIPFSYQNAEDTHKNENTKRKNWKILKSKRYTTTQITTSKMFTGTIRIKICEACGLRPTDFQKRHNMTFGKPDEQPIDPYVSIDVDENHLGKFLRFSVCSFLWSPQSDPSCEIARTHFLPLLRYFFSAQMLPPRTSRFGCPPFFLIRWFFFAKGAWICGEKKSKQICAKKYVCNRN